MRNIEYAFIGGCITDPDIVGESFVHEDYFTSSMCAKIFELMKSGVVDPLLIARETGFEEDIKAMITISVSSQTRKQGREIAADYKRRKFIMALDVAYRDLNQGCGVDSVLAGITAATEFSSDTRYEHIENVAMKVYEDMAARQNGEDYGRFIETGFVDFDKMTGGIERGSLVVVAGRPSMGKTAFAMNVCQRVAMNYTVCFSSIEMDKLQIGYRLLASLSKSDLKKLRADRNFPAHIWQSAADATTTMQKMNLYIDDNPKRTASQISAQARRHKARYGSLDLLMVDYLGLIEAESKTTKQRHLEIADMTRMFKGVAKELDCCVMLLCQLNRSGDTEQPKMSHLRESGAIEQDADMILMPYRYKETETNRKDKSEIEVEKAKILIVKNRNGVTGEVPVSWVGKCASYENLAYER